MSKHIGILEVNYHSQNAYYLARILKDRYDVTLIVDPDIKEKLQTFPGDYLGDISWIVRDKSETVREFLSRINKQVFDFLFIGTATGTAPDLVKFARLSSGIPSVTYVYKVYNWLAPKPYLSWSIRDMIRENSRSLARQYVISKQNVLLSEYQTGEKLMGSVRGGAEVQMLRPLFRSDWSNETGFAGDEFRLVVPGAITQNRGVEYADLLRIATEFPENIAIELLGRPKDNYGENIVEKAAAASQFKTNNEWIPHTEFATAIETADLLLGPFSRSGMTWKTGSRYEHRSVSVGSGITLDAIKYATPLMLPEYYNYDPELADGVETYNSINEIPKVIENLISVPNNRVTQMQTSIEEVSENYNMSKQRDRFESFVEDMIRGNNT
jgi:hypothetical protein